MQEQPARVPRHYRKIIRRAFWVFMGFSLACAYYQFQARGESRIIRPATLQDISTEELQRELLLRRSPTKWASPSPDASSTEGSSTTTQMTSMHEDSESHDIHTNTIVRESPETTEIPQIFQHSVGYTMGGHQLWSEGVRLLGNDALRSLVGSASEYKLGRLGVFGPTDDAGVKLVLSEQWRDVYGFKQMQVSSGDVYLDIGGHIGIPVLLALRRHPQLSVICVEPLPENYFFIRWNLLANGFKTNGSKVQILNLAAASESNSVLQVHYMPRATTSSGAFKSKEAFKEPVWHAVKTISLHDILVDHVQVGHRVALLKLDCEGCEWSAIAALSDSEFKQLFSAKVIGEIHMMPTCTGNWRDINLHCDDNFMTRTCGTTGKGRACCVSFQRMCFQNRPDGWDCEHVLDMLKFNSLTCSTTTAISSAHGGSDVGSRRGAATHVSVRESPETT